MSDQQAESIEQGQGILEKSSHPVALVFHFLFRSAAVLAYLFCTLFTNNQILAFVLTVLFLAFDFWVVKNITGRLLVGLRWWNEVKADGTSAWMFESRGATVKVNANDSRLFWLGLYVYPIFWVLLGIIAIFNFHLMWLLAVIFALVLNMANLVGYSKCDRDAKKKMVNNFGQNLVGTFISGRLNSMFS